jgi:hypothetical protein
MAMLCQAAEALASYVIFLAVVMPEVAIGRSANVKNKIKKSMSTFHRRPLVNISQRDLTCYSNQMRNSRLAALRQMLRA